MTVSVEGVRGCVVSEDALDRAYTNAFADHKGRISVPQIVKADVRQPGPLKQRLEVTPVDVALIERRSDLRTEHQPVVFPLRGAAHPLFELAFSMQF